MYKYIILIFNTILSIKIISRWEKEKRRSTIFFHSLLLAALGTLSFRPYLFTGKVSNLKENQKFRKKKKEFHVGREYYCVVLIYPKVNNNYLGAIGWRM